MSRGLGTRDLGLGTRGWTGVRSLLIREQRGVRGQSVCRTWTSGCTTGAPCLIHSPQPPVVSPRVLLAVICLLLVTMPVLNAQTGMTGKDLLPPMVREIGIDQRLGEQLPLDLVFKDEGGNPVALREFFGRKPVVLSFAYYQCPMLCTMILNGLTKAMRASTLELGRDFEVVNISIDPKETPALAAQKKEGYVREYGHPGAAAAWHFLTGEEEAIRKATAAAGFRYRYDPENKQYAHASGIMVLTPDGKFARYFYGIEYSARDLKLGLVEAADRKIGSPADQVLLFCFHYDPVTGKYGLVIMNFVRILGSATVIVLASFMILMFRRERRMRLAAGR
jgi:protein SCO1